jgi:phage-related baseplate assembly protein
LSELSNLPDINFVDTDVETLLTNMVAEYEAAYLAQTGASKKLYPGDPIRIWIYTQALRYYQALVLIDASAKQNLLKYASGAYLDNLGASYGPAGIRLAASKAVTTMRYVLSAIQASDTIIPAGNRTSPGGNVFFATLTPAIIAAGNTAVDVVAECTDAGAAGNGYTAGQINILVDPIAYVESVSNIDTSQGGSDIEADDAYRERLFLLPESFSVAGPAEAYEFFTKQCNASIMDVKVTSPSAGVADVRFILAGGEIPGAPLIAAVLAYLSDKTRRPLTDSVTVQAPAVTNYDITFTYYIRTTDAAQATEIQVAVAAAVDDYVIWQKSKIGRSINPSELIARVVQAGAKRVVLTLPEYAAIAETALAVASATSITYGGLEDE